MPGVELDAVARAFCLAHGHSFIAPVGAGAFKETFRIVLATGEERALKVFKPGYSAERTGREIDAMQKCSHPNVAQLFSLASFFVESEQFLILLEEFLAGGTLTARIKQQLLSTKESIPMWRQLVQAVAHIAERDLVHRDLKPDNILFRTDRQTPVIVDFGLVRSLLETSLTQSWLMRGPGTPFFASAEQLRTTKRK